MLQKKRHFSEEPIPLPTLPGPSLTPAIANYMGQSKNRRNFQSGWCPLAALLTPSKKGTEPPNSDTPACVTRMPGDPCSGTPTSGAALAAEARAREAQRDKLVPFLDGFQGKPKGNHLEESVPNFWGKTHTHTHTTRSHASLRVSGHQGHDPWGMQHSNRMILSIAKLSRRATLRPFISEYKDISEETHTYMWL